MKKYILIIFMVSFIYNISMAQTELEPNPLIPLNPNEEIYSMDISPDESLLIVSVFIRGIDVDPTFIIWDTRNNQLLKRVTLDIESFDNDLSTAVFLDNDHYLVGYGLGRAAVFSLSSGEVYPEIQSPSWDPQANPFGPAIIDAAFLDDKSIFITADIRGYIQIWDLKTGEEIRRIKNNEWGTLEAINIFKDNVHFLLNAGRGDFIGSIEDNNKIIELPGWNFATMHKNRETVIKVGVGSNINEIKLNYWDVNGNLIDETMEISREDTTRFLIQEEGKLVAEISEDDEITIIDPHKGVRLAKLNTTVNSTIMDTLFFASGQKLLTAKDSEAIFFDLSDIISGIANPFNLDN